MLEKTLKFTGSIKLAIPVLTALVGILIWATFYEARVGSAIVQTEVYKSVWFGGLMMLLVVNLGSSALLRYPWRGPRKIGFALTHLGLIVLITGAAAVIHISVEGMLPIRMDDAPNNLIQLEGDAIEVLTPTRQQQQANILIKPDGSIVPKTLGGLQLLHYSPATIETVQFADTGSVKNPAVRLQLSSDRMGQTLERWLAVAPDAYHKTSIGPAVLELVPAENEAQLQSLLTPPSASPTGKMGKLQVTIGSEVPPIDLDVATHLDKAVRLSDITIRAIDAWVDFRLDAEGRPINASDRPGNPAVQLEVSQGNSIEKWFVFAQSDFPPIRSVIAGEAIDLQIVYDFAPPPPTDGFRIVVTPDDRLFYAAWSSQGWKTGALQIGEAVSPGWADFQITLVEKFDRARLDRQIVPVAAPGESTSPALQVRTPDGLTHWLPWGEPTTLETASGEFFAAFSPRLLELPFTVQLEDFIVERNEGSESIAMWTSQVRLVEPIQGEQVDRKVWMNHPTWFDGWKLAQASWNPGDLRQSTLQVKREPWWITSLTWAGSLLVISGIVVMFYGAALLQKVRQFQRSSGRTIAQEAREVVPDDDASPPVAVAPLAGKSL